MELYRSKELTVNQDELLHTLLYGTARCKKRGHSKTVELGNFSQVAWLWLGRMSRAGNSSN